MNTPTENEQNPWRPLEPGEEPARGDRAKMRLSPDSPWLTVWMPEQLDSRYEFQTRRPRPAASAPDADLDEFTKGGTKAWADVPDAAQWVRDQRQTSPALEDARQLLADIANHDCNPEDEAEKWLREYGWPKDSAPTAELLEIAWGIIANAGNPQGDWATCTKNWQEAAVRWRDQYFATLRGKDSAPAAPHTSSTSATPEAGEGAGGGVLPVREFDWPEDFHYENGNYWNKCIECEREFRGHKRRVLCKLCAHPFDWNVEEAKSEQAGGGDQTSLAHAASRAIDAMAQTRRLYQIPDTHLLATAQRELDAALSGVEDVAESGGGDQQTAPVKGPVCGLLGCTCHWCNMARIAHADPKAFKDMVTAREGVENLKLKGIEWVPIGRLEQVADRADRAEAEALRYRQSAEHHAQQCKHAIQQRDQAEAERDRLREAYKEAIAFIKKLNATKGENGRQYRSWCGQFLAALNQTTNH